MFKGDVVKAAVGSKTAPKASIKILIHLGALRFVDPEDVKGYVDLLKLKHSVFDSRVIGVVDNPSESYGDQYICHLNNFERYFPMNEILKPISLKKVRKLAKKERN